MFPFFFLLQNPSPSFVSYFYGCLCPVHFNLISLWWWYHFIAIIRQLASDSKDHWWRWRGNGGGLRHLLVCAVCRWCETLLDATATATAPRPFFLPVCQSVCVCVWVWVCLSVSLWVVVVQRTWRQAQSGPSATSQGTVCTVYWVPAGYICFFLSFFQSHSFSLPHCFVLSFFFFFCKHISPSLSVCRVQILQTGIIPCLLQGLWLSLCWSCLRSKIFLHWKAVV